MTRLNSNWMRFALVAAMLALTPAAWGTVSCSGSLLCTGTAGSLAATAAFSIVGGNLQVVLTNTSTADVVDPPGVLTALFFNIAGNPTLSSLSAVLTAGSTVLFDAAPPGGVVGGEWAYGSGLSAAGYGTNLQGISSAGFGLFGDNTFPGGDLDPPTAVNGLNYGITSAGDNPATGNAAVTGGNPLIKNSVTFTLGSLPTGFALNQISNVIFQYGTALSPTDPCIGCLQEVPEPSAMFSLPLIGAALVWHVRRRMRRSEA